MQTHPIPQRLPAPALDQLALLFRPLSDGQIRCVLQLDGHLDAERLARAFRLSLDAEPVLGSRFVRHRGRCTWARRADLDALPLCEKIVCADAQAQEVALGRFLVAPLDPLAGPAAQARLLRGDTDTLVVKLHHLAADGIGLLQFVIVLAGIYRELGSSPGYRPRPNLASRGQGRVLRRFGPAGLLGALGRSGGAARPGGWGPIATSDDRSGPGFALRRLGPERVRALRAWGRAHGVSVNDLLLAALYEALFATLGAPSGRQLTVGVPIDLRRYLPPGQPPPVCNLSASADVAIVREATDAFADTLGRVHEAMAALKASPRGLALAVLAEAIAWPHNALARTALEQVVRRIARTGEARPFFSNVGIIDAGLVEFGGRAVLDAYGLGTVSYPPGLLITASTFRESLTIASGFCAGATARELVERLLDRLVCALPG